MNRPGHSFYPPLLKDPKGNQWFCNVAIGHNSLDKMAKLLLSLVNWSHHHVHLNTEVWSDRLGGIPLRLIGMGLSLSWTQSPITESCLLRMLLGHGLQREPLLAMGSVHSGQTDSVKDHIPVMIVASIWGCELAGHSATSSCDNLAVVSVLKVNTAGRRT